MFRLQKCTAYWTLLTLSLSLYVWGWAGSCSILLRWEQTQLTASFLTVNIAAPLRYGSGTRTPLHLPLTALPTKRVSLTCNPPSSSFISPGLGWQHFPALRHAARHVTPWSAFYLSSLHKRTLSVTPFFCTPLHPLTHKLHSPLSARSKQTLKDL